MLRPWVATSRSVCTQSLSRYGHHSVIRRAMASAADQAQPSREELLHRIAQLESQLKHVQLSSVERPFSGEGTPIQASIQQRSGAGVLKKDKGKRGEVRDNEQTNDFFDRYPSRKIALKFCYEGWLYGGLALQNIETPLPTVEGVLLDALVQARLIRSVEDPVEQVDFSRCGRTDRGVSAAGQVVSLYVRSQLNEVDGQKQIGWRAAKFQTQQERSATGAQADDLLLSPQELHNRQQKWDSKKKSRPELPYVHLLNRILPPSIRVLAWSPVQPEFDARFSCQSRHYKYFFSTNKSGMSSNLDIGAMRRAASKLLGEHDFRNFCKVDPTKQIHNFRRRILRATIDDLPGSSATQEEEQQYVFNLEGTAFLYHQVRHIMAILFLVGSGREQPEIVDALLNTGYYQDEGPEGNSHVTLSSSKDLPVVPCKPSYEMAEDLPLVLWDCRFLPEDVDWRQNSSDDSDEVSTPTSSKATTSVAEAMYPQTCSHQIKSIISQHFLQAARQIEPTRTAGPQTDGKSQPDNTRDRTRTHVGAGRLLSAGKYTALLQRPRGDKVEVINQRWLEGQGKRRAERKGLPLHQRVLSE